MQKKFERSDKTCSVTHRLEIMAISQVISVKDIRLCLFIFTTETQSTRREEKKPQSGHKGHKERVNKREV
ncbi:hypothetical protein CAL7102_04371 [Dulcicalothrix desertica PCC 7102]|nr:hypothetical protein CAL7102_04371 [Dulcicalothrix desertica PCC 7102]